MKKIYSLIVALLMIAGQQASAQLTEQTRQVSGYSSLTSSGPFQVHVKLDGTESLRISGDEALIKDIETVVEKGILQIKFKKDFEWSGKMNKVDVYVTAKTLKLLVNTGSGSIKVDGTINTNDFKAVLSGSGSITTDVKTQNLHAVISGSGSINLTGSTNEADLVISGSGQLQGKSLNTENTSAVVTGSGQVYIAADKQVNTRIVGSGQVIYSGNAKVEALNRGSGRVIKAN